MIEAFGEAYFLGQLHGAGAALGGAHAHVEHGDFEVFQHGELLDEVEILEDESDAAASDFGEFVVVEAADVDAAQDIAAAGGLIEAANDVHEGGFARSAGAHDGGIFAFDEIDIDGAKGGDFDVGAGFVIDLGEVLD